MQLKIYLAALLLVGSTAVLSHPLDEALTKREEIPVDECKKRALSEMKVARTIAEITVRDIAIIRRCGGGGDDGGDDEGGDDDDDGDDGDDNGEGNSPPESGPDPGESYPDNLPPVPELIQSQNPSELQALAYWLQGKQVQTALSVAATTLSLLGQALTPIGVGIAITEGVIEIISLVDPAP